MITFKETKLIFFGDSMINATQICETKVES